MQNSQLRSTASRLIDSVIITFTGWVAIRWSIYDFSSVSSNPALFTIASVAAGLLAYIIFPLMNVYRSWRGSPFSSLLVRITFAWLVVCFIVVAVLFFLVGGALISRRWVTSWIVYGALALILFRLITSSALKAASRKGFNQKAVMLMGYGPLGQLVHRRTQINSDTGFGIKYVMNGSTDVFYPTAGVKLVADLDEMEKLVREQKIHEVWVTLSISEHAQLANMLARLRNDLVDIRWFPDLFSLQILSHKFEDFMGVTAVHLNATPAPGANGLLKQIFDRAFALVALLCLLPALIAISCAVKLSSPGPVFFRQPRQGQGGRQFMIYKFRTMKVHHESGEVTQAKRGDTRITTVGAFLRRTSLDELPQFLNVLLGDMSVVGPRPHAIEHNKFYTEKINDYMLRHVVKPGITGWAQINGWRGETDTIEKMARRIECDIYYITHWTFFMDIKIIWRTLFKGWYGANAY